MRSLFVAVAVAYLVILAGLYLVQRKLLYFPDPRRPLPAEAGVPEMRAVTLRTADGLDIVAWWRPPTDGGQPVILFLHGNAGHLGVRAFKIRPMLDRGWGVLLPAWRGYSGNPGSPTEAGLYEDGRAALRFLERQGIDPSRLAFYGESLGGGVAVQLATETEPGAMVLEAPFTSVPDVAQPRFPFAPARLLVKDRFNSLAKITSVTVPLLIVHGVQDEIVPVRYGRRLFEAARQPKTARFIEGAGHNDLYAFGTEGIVLQFVGDALVHARQDHSG